MQCFRIVRDKHIDILLLCHHWHLIVVEQQLNIVVILIQRLVKEIVNKEIVHQVSVVRDWDCKSFETPFVKRSN